MSATVNALPEWRVLARSAVAASCDAGGTGENVLAQVAVPGGLLGKNGMIRVWSTWSATNNGNTKTARVRFGGYAGTAFMAANYAGNASFSAYYAIMNRNSTSSQIANINATNGAGITAGGSAATTGVIDTTQDQVLVLSGQKNTGSDTFTLESFVVEILSDGT